MTTHEASAQNVQKIRLGKDGLQSVSAISLGCMGMSAMYGAADEAQSIATIHAALDAGINLIDTGDFYGAGHNEMLIGRALKGRRDQALISVKFGALRSPDGGFIGIDGRPAAVKNFLAYTLQRLGTDHIGSRTLKQLVESLGALNLTLSNEDLRRIETAVPADEVAGTRYDASQMKHLDSEK